MTTTFDGLLGFREVAGLRAPDGRRIRRGLLYRSGTPQFLTAEAAQELYAATGIRTVVDLRLPHEVQREGSGHLLDLPVWHVPISIRIRGLIAADSAVAPMAADDPLVTNYLRYLRHDPSAIAAVVATLAEPGALPALVHCTVGKDRTGAAIALLLDAIGVCRADIAADYAAGQALIAPAMERLRSMASYGDAVDVYPPEAWHAPPEVIRRFLAAVDAEHDGIRAFLGRHGVGADVLATLTARVTENDDNQGGQPCT
jgi:protein tyrosine/serine phosphatase